MCSGTGAAVIQYRLYIISSALIKVAAVYSRRMSVSEYYQLDVCHLRDVVIVTTFG